MSHKSFVHFPPAFRLQAADPVRRVIVSECRTGAASSAVPVEKPVDQRNSLMDRGGCGNGG
jgi:hypothetical protein